MKDERILALIELQKVVDEKNALIRTHESVPARLEELHKAIENIRLKLEEAEKAASENDALVQRSKKEVQEGESRLTELQSKLNQVKTTREYESRQKELNTQRTRLNELSDIIARTEGETEKLTQMVADAKKNYEEIQNEFAEEIAELEKESAKFEKIVTEIENREQDARSKVPPEILDRVLKLFRVRGGVGIVAINDGSCGGCGIQVSPQTIQLAKRGLDLIQCDRCSSYQYWDDAED